MIFKPQFVIASLTLTSICTPLASAQEIVTEDFRIQASDGERGDYFGSSIAIKNNIIAVGSIYDFLNDEFETYSGSAYLFDATTGMQLHKLVPSNAQDFASFGSSIDIDDGAVIVGAPDDSSAHIYNISTGHEVGQLFSFYNFGRFGYSVALDSGIAVVGEPGSSGNTGGAFLYNVFSGELTSQLFANDGANGDRFGHHVAIHNGLVAVSALNDDSNTGAVYIFDAHTGSQISKIVPPQAGPNDYFGDSLDMNDDTIAVGAIGDSDNGPYSGAVYLYRTSDFSFITKLTASDGMEEDIFGKSIALSDDSLVVGAEWSNFSGAAYIFSLDTEEEFVNLMTNEIVWTDSFASAVAIENNTVVAGAPTNSNGGEPESAYVFTIPEAPQSLCPADLTGDDTLNFFDVSAFLLAFTASDPIADFTNDNTWNFFDVSAFLSSFASGCP